MSNNMGDFPHQAELASQYLQPSMDRDYIGEVHRCADRLRERANGDPVIEELATHVAKQANYRNVQAALEAVAGDIAHLAIFKAQAEAGWARHFGYPNATTPDSFRNYHTWISGSPRLATKATVDSILAIKHYLYDKQPHSTPQAEEG